MQPLMFPKAEGPKDPTLGLPQPGWAQLAFSAGPAGLGSDAREDWCSPHHAPQNACTPAAGGLVGTQEGRGLTCRACCGNEGSYRLVWWVLGLTGLPSVRPGPLPSGQSSGRVSEALKTVSPHWKGYRGLGQTRLLRPDHGFSERRRQWAQSARLWPTPSCLPAQTKPWGPGGGHPPPQEARSTEAHPPGRCGTSCR